jgi:hypothetical protein
MNDPDRTSLLFFALAAVLLTGTAIAIPVKARDDIATICRAGPSTGRAQPPRTTPSLVAGRLSGMP